MARSKKKADGVKCILTAHRLTASSLHRQQFPPSGRRSIESSSWRTRCIATTRHRTQGLCQAEHQSSQAGQSFERRAQARKPQHVRLLSWIARLAKPRKQLWHQAAGETLVQRCPEQYFRRGSQKQLCLAKYTRSRGQEQTICLRATGSVDAFALDAKGRLWAGELVR